MVVVLQVNSVVVALCEVRCITQSSMRENCNVHV